MDKIFVGQMQEAMKIHAHAKVTAFLILKERKMANFPIITGVYLSEERPNSIEIAYHESDNQYRTFYTLISVEEFTQEANKYV